MPSPGTVTGDVGASWASGSILPALACDASSRPGGLMPTSCRVPPPSGRFPFSADPDVGKEAPHPRARGSCSPSAQPALRVSRAGTRRLGLRGRLRGHRPLPAPLAPGLPAS